MAAESDQLKRACSRSRRTVLCDIPASRRVGNAHGDEIHFWQLGAGHHFPAFRFMALVLHWFCYGLLASGWRRRGLSHDNVRTAKRHAVATHQLSHVGLNGGFVFLAMPQGSAPAGGT